MRQSYCKSIQFRVVFVFIYAWTIEIEASKTGRGAYKDMGTYWVEYDIYFLKASFNVNIGFILITSNHSHGNFPAHCFYMLSLMLYNILPVCVFIRVPGKRCLYVMLGRLPMVPSTFGGKV